MGLLLRKVNMKPTKLRPYYHEIQPKLGEGAWLVRGPTQASSLAFLEEGARGRALNYAEGMNEVHEYVMKEMLARERKLKKEIRELEHRLNCKPGIPGVPN